MERQQQDDTGNLWQSPLDALQRFFHQGGVLQEEEWPKESPHSQSLITDHADRQHPVDDGDCNDYCVADQPFVLSEFLPANQVALDSEINREDDEADHLDALCEATGRLPGRRAKPRVRGYGQRGRALNERQQ